MSEAVSVHNACKKFGGSHLMGWERQYGQLDSRFNEALKEVVAVDHISFQVHRSEIFGVVGPSGSGKSTLLRLLATLLLPDSGRLRVFGYDVVSHSQQVQQMTNRISGSASFFKKLSPLDNLFYGARPTAARYIELRRQAIEILGRLGLDEYDLQSPMSELHLVSQKKVELARALLARPRLLLLDEPTANLDVRSKAAVHALLREFRDLHGVTVLLATRDLVEASALCDRIALMDDGKIAAIDTPPGIKRVLL